ncbi:MAG: endolytic transglycosylase MltG [Acidobacteria bacterium]|nr:endolytic transglycosylase MltG [Acidobacteriota bacterium]
MRQQRQQKQQKKPRSKFNLFVIFVLLPLALFGGACFWLRLEMNRPHAHEATKKLITIEPGSSTNQIIARLNREGILATQLPVKLWLRSFGRGQVLKAGDYTFKSPITPIEVINRLGRGDIATKDFVIPEGFNYFDVARVVASLQGMKERQMKPETVMGLLKNRSLIEDLDPQATTLEGYLFPDTYEYTVNSTREQLIEAMVKRFRKVYTSEMQQRADELGLTTRQVITLASLIEKEARVDSERELISSVFHRRLEKRIQLACDPTLIYAALIEGKYRGKIYQSDLDRDSPYNTYKKLGLPPGPIASPGQRSIQAALYPAETNYLYFVVDATKNDGSHKFSASSREHVEAVKLLRQQERNQQTER